MLIPLLVFFGCLGFAFVVCTMPVSLVRGLLPPSCHPQDENPDVAENASSFCKSCTGACSNSRRSTSPTTSPTVQSTVEMTVQPRETSTSTDQPPPRRQSHGGTATSARDDSSVGSSMYDSSEAPPAAAAFGSVSLNPLTDGGPRVYRVSEKPGESTLGCFKFNHTLLGSVGLPDEHAANAFSVSTDRFNISSHPDHTVQGFVVVPLSPSLLDDGGDLYVNVKRDEMEKLDAALVVLPTDLIGPGIERLWVGEVQAKASALDTAKRVFGLEREQGWAVFCSDGKQFSCNGQHTDGGELPWWPQEKFGKRTTVGWQLPAKGQVVAVTKQKEGTPLPLRRPFSSAVEESLSAVFVIPSGVHLTVETNALRIKDLRGSNAVLFTPSS